MVDAAMFGLQHVAQQHGDASAKYGECKRAVLDTLAWAVQQLDEWLVGDVAFQVGAFGWSHNAWRTGPAQGLHNTPFVVDPHTHTHTHTCR